MITTTLLLIVLVTGCQTEIELQGVKITNDTVRPTMAGVNRVFNGARAIRVVFYARQLQVSSREDPGPFFLSNEGREFSFLTTWDTNMLLTNNRRAVQIEYNGLYIIAAQLKYKSTGDNTDPVCFKIHVRKLIRDANSRAPITIAECVRPSLKRFEVATCNTFAVLFNSSNLASVVISRVNVGLQILILISGYKCSFNQF